MRQVNRKAVLALALHGSQSEAEALKQVVDGAVERLGLGGEPAPSPLRPGGGAVRMDTTRPSLHDVIAWLENPPKADYLFIRRLQETLKLRCGG